MTGDVRDQLAESLPESLGPVSLRRPSPPLIPNGRPAPRGYGDQLIDALLPTVSRLVAQGAADALEAASDWLAGTGPNGSLPDGCAPDATSGGLSWRKDVVDRDSALDWCQMSLVDRAALLAPPATDAGGRQR